MRFCSVINCMDGRVQLPVFSYLQKRFKAEYVDTITEAGPNLILSEQKNQDEIQSILKRLKISIEHHNSVGVAIVGHHDCAGNPTHKNKQIKHLHSAIQFIQAYHENVEIIGLWVNENWEIQEVTNFEVCG